MYFSANFLRNFYEIPPAIYLESSSWFFLLEFPWNLLQEFLWNLLHKFVWLLLQEFLWSLNSEFLPGFPFAIPTTFFLKIPLIFFNWLSASNFVDNPFSNLSWGSSRNFCVSSYRENHDLSRDFSKFLQPNLRKFVSEFLKLFIQEFSLKISSVVSQKIYPGIRLKFSEIHLEIPLE